MAETCGDVEAHIVRLKLNKIIMIRIPSSQYKSQLFFGYLAVMNQLRSSCKLPLNET
jgi:hypothetical protein